MCSFKTNALIAMYGKCGEVDAARKLFDMMPERDLVTWNSMLNGYASKGMWTEAFKLFEKMQAAGVIFNIITWNIIAGGCLQAGNYEGALKLLCQMRASGAHFDSVALIIGLGACSNFGALAFGEGIHGYAVHSCFNQVENGLEFQSEMANLKCFILTFLIALAFSSLDQGFAARNLLQTAPTAVPGLPTLPPLPKQTLPPLPAVPTFPTTQPSLPKPPTTLPPLPGLPTMPTVPTYMPLICSH
ncbi:Pentatricopeptide repeat [Dillenia turbinata]|uniref:Pentatricopeptide repeat n=1 Tax=Dillenia turbinata TaxID=194707 RepID=A0AAN8UVF4_9MAGN